MVKQSKRRSRPMPDALTLSNIYQQLHQALNKEKQFVCNAADRKPWEVTTSARDGAVHVMRFLKIWFDLPQIVFFTAVNYLDMFLARMQVQEKFLSCLSVSCFNIATINHGFKINSSQLVSLSQSKCSVKDMERMSKVITQKLNLENTKFCNTLDLLEIYMDIYKYVAGYFRIEALLNRMLSWQQLCTRLEVLICDSSCACFKPSLLSLAFIHFEMERFLSREIPRKSNYYTMEMFYVIAVMVELKELCNINCSDYLACFEAVSRILKEYDGRNKAKHPQKLIWKFSLSTHALSEYIQHCSQLNTVAEE